MPHRIKTNSGPVIGHQLQPLRADVIGLFRRVGQAGAFVRGQDDVYYVGDRQQDAPRYQFGGLALRRRHAFLHRGSLAQVGGDLREFGGSGRLSAVRGTLMEVSSASANRL